jgi:hypothetical protein
MLGTPTILPNKKYKCFVVVYVLFCFIVFFFPSFNLFSFVLLSFLFFFFYILNLVSRCWNFFFFSFVSSLFPKLIFIFLSQIYRACSYYYLLHPPPFFHWSYSLPSPHPTPKYTQFLFLISSNQC